MPTKYATQIANAQAKIRAKGQLVHYQPALPAIQPNDPAQPFRVGPSGYRMGVELSNLVNASLSGLPMNAQSVPNNDNNITLPSIDIYMVFLDAKARGSSTQGMVAEFVSRTDIVGGNKLGLMAGGQGINAVPGDTIDRNTGDITGYPLYTVAKFKTVDVDGAVILYTLELEL